jgi:hypothetical protein
LSERQWNFLRRRFDKILSRGRGIVFAINIRELNARKWSGDKVKYEAESSQIEAAQLRVGGRGGLPPALKFYEFRVLTKAGNISMSIQEAHTTDHQAILSARRLAKGEAFEVWRGIVCVHPISLTRR